MVWTLVTIGMVALLLYFVWVEFQNDPTLTLIGLTLIILIAYLARNRKREDRHDATSIGDSGDTSDDGNGD